MDRKYRDGTVIKKGDRCVVVNLEYESDFFKLFQRCKIEEEYTGYRRGYVLLDSGCIIPSTQLLREDMFKGPKKYIQPMRVIRD